MADLRYRIRALILGIAGIIVAILFIRIILQLIAVPTSSVFVQFFYAISDFFIYPFQNAIEIPAGNPIQAVNVDALVAIAIYVLGAIALSEILTAFLYDSAEGVIQNLVDAVFKVIEFLIFIRIVLDLFALFDRRTAPMFIQNVFNLTDWASTMVNPIPIADGNLNISAILALTIVVIIDIFTERFLSNIFANVSGAVKSVNVKRVVNIIPKFERREPPPPPPPQNIVINIPQQTPPPK